MAWSTIQNLKEQLRKKWLKGLFLSRDGLDSFPLQVSIKGPQAREFAQRFAEIDAWVQDFATASSGAASQLVLWEEQNNRATGKNRIPVKLQFGSVENLAGFLHKQKQLEHWQYARQIIRNEVPELESWWLQHSKRALELSGDPGVLTKLLRTTQWMRQYIDQSWSSVYIRQIPLQGIHTKFVEAHKMVLSSWLDTLCDPAKIDSSYTSGSGFARRYGFLDKPLQVRLRILDPSLYINGCSDLTLIAQEFQTLDLPVQKVFICENDISCLSFPLMENSLVIFGRGYGFAALAGCTWLKNTEITYWGDLDTNGFCILDQLRGHLPHVKSMLMDEETLLQHREFWAEESKQAHRNLQRLTPAEKDLYQKLCTNHWGKSVRLEQELIGYRWVEKRLRKSDTGF